MHAPLSNLVESSNHQCGSEGGARQTDVLSRKRTFGSTDRDYTK